MEIKLDNQKRMDNSILLKNLVAIRTNIYKNPRKARLELDSLIDYFDLKKRSRSLSGLLRFIDKEIKDQFKDFINEFNEKNETDFGTNRIASKKTIIEFHGLDENGKKRDKFNYKEHVETIPFLMLKRINKEKKMKAIKNQYTNIIYTPMGNKR